MKRITLIVSDQLAATILSTIASEDIESLSMERYSEILEPEFSQTSEPEPDPGPQSEPAPTETIIHLKRKSPAKRRDPVRSDKRAVDIIMEMFDEGRIPQRRFDDLRQQLVKLGFSQDTVHGAVSSLVDTGQVCRIGDRMNRIIEFVSDEPTKVEA